MIILMSLQEMLNKFEFDNPLWWVSQFFALIALIFLVWSFQVKNKVKVMTLIGLGSFFLALSAPFLGNWSLGFLFGLAAIRNFVFAYLDWRKNKNLAVTQKVYNVALYVLIITTILSIFLLWFLGYYLSWELNGVHMSYLSVGVVIGITALFVALSITVIVLAIKNKKLENWPNYFFAAVFAISTITAFLLLYAIGMAFWLELMICITLIGLIIGNILKGQNLMRLSFVANRVFNIFNHLYFGNLIGVIIASMAIGSNLLYYLRMLIAKIKNPHVSFNPVELPKEPPINNIEQSTIENK